ncbi:MAG: P-loop NTPase fold protein [Balneola sp.]
MARKEEEPKRKSKKAGPTDLPGGPTQAGGKSAQSQQDASNASSEFEQFAKSESFEDSKKRSVEGVYKKGGLTVNLESGTLPSDENIIILFDFESIRHSDSYDEFVLKILKSLGLNKDYLFNIKPDFELQGYQFFQFTESQLICIRLLHTKENPSPLNHRIIKELRYMFKDVVVNKIYDTSLYFVLEENQNIRVSPLYFFDEIIDANTDSISFTIPFPLKHETRLSYDIGDWEVISQAGFNYGTSPNKNEKIDFHLDDPALEDKLGRKPIAKSLAKLINDDIFGNKKCHAFMTHLQGRWGEGKSSFMKFLENGLQEAGNDRWVVIHYNAWKNQDVDPPWWTFLDAVYRQGREQIANKSGKRFRFRVRLNEHIRRLNSGTLLILSVFAFIIFLILSASNLLRISFLDLPETAKIVVSASTILASLWAIGQSWSKFFITNTPENARLFMRRTENPSAHIKQHFEELIKDLQTKHRKGKENYHIAVFIDDLDRCDGKFVVSLLEGIQTMFNEQKVFYLVAADKHWIAKSFENVYSEYTDTVKKGTKLGYSFIEKNFQLSIRLPNPSAEQISRYWGHILKQESYNQLSGTGNTEGLKRQLQETGQEAVLSGEANLEELAEQYNTSIEDAQNIMLETVNETTEDIEHLLMEHHKLLGNNPRAVKRLANQYTVYRNLVLIEQNKVDPLKLFRWVILQNRWPVLVDKLEQDPAHINDYDELLEELDLVSYSIDIEYVMGKDDEKITLNDVVTYTGISQITSGQSS